MDAETWLALVAAAHAGFQLTVTGVVYPALADASADRWDRVHAAHSRRITPLVALLYPPLVLLAGWVLLVEPADPARWIAVAGAALAVLTTALVAAPLHGRLGEGASPDRLRRLLAADRVRAAGALVCLAGAAWLLA